MAVGTHGRSQLPGRLALLLLSLALCAAAAEWLVRALPSTTLGFRYDAREGRFHRPSEFVLDGAANSLGFHDAEPGPAREGTPRIVILGDSYVQGYWGPAREAIGQRLEWHLQSGHRSAVEVVAFGKAGWSQLEQLAALERYGERMRPDLVLTVFLPFNDVAENNPRLREQAAAQFDQPGFVMRPGWSRNAADSMPLLFVRSSVLNQLISHRIANSGLFRKMQTRQSPRSIPIHYHVYRSETDELWQESWQITEDLVVETRDRAHALGADYALVSASTPHGVKGPEAGLEWLMASYPAMATFEWDLELPGRRIQEICERNGIPFMNLEPAFRAATREGRVLHWPFDGHWNGEGTDFAAQRVAEFVMEMRRED